MIRTIRQQQSLFAKLLGQLYVFVYEHDGWELTLGDGYRADHLGHNKNSCHYIRLAQDLNLFIDGIWEKDDCPQWHVIGGFWKHLDPDARWGGDFPLRDYNHFSLIWGGAA